MSDQAFSPDHPAEQETIAEERQQDAPSGIPLDQFWAMLDPIDA